MPLLARRIFKLIRGFYAGAVGGAGFTRRQARAQGGTAVPVANVGFGFMSARFGLLQLVRQDAISCSCQSSDSLAEWSKALAQGASPQGRGFEPHSCHVCRSRRFLSRATASITPAGFRRSRCSLLGWPNSLVGPLLSLGVWRNGSASDSRSEGWEFESLCPHCAVAFSFRFK